jgi:LAO/AO transport system kinase
VRRLSVDQYVAGVLAADRAVLARAVTLVESNRDDDRRLAQEVLAAVLPRTGGATRVGISGPPGAGKSTLIEALGVRLVEQGRRVAVLAVDPSSSVSGGSVLGDKTRMTRLGQDARAFVRPSAAGGSLGGVHRKTRETMLLVEAAGYDVVLIETVGVGQSEIAVADMVDTVLLLMLPGAGDEVQGIKRGILEIADVIAVTKADGDHAALAAIAQVQLAAAMRLMRPGTPAWTLPVLRCSAATGEGVDPLWAAVDAHREAQRRSGAFDARRRAQRGRWMWDAVESTLIERLRRDPNVTAMSGALELAVEAGEEPPTRAAERILSAFGVATSGDVA